MQIEIIDKYEAYLIYNGTYHKNDDPADYYELSAMKGVAVA